MDKGGKSFGSYISRTLDGISVRKRELAIPVSQVMVEDPSISFTNTGDRSTSVWVTAYQFTPNLRNRFFGEIYWMTIRVVGPIVLAAPPEIAISGLEQIKTFFDTTEQLYEDLTVHMWKVLVRQVDRVVFVTIKQLANDLGSALTQWPMSIKYYIELFSLSVDPYLRPAAAVSVSGFTLAPRVEHFPNHVGSSLGSSVDLVDDY